MISFEKVHKKFGNLVALNSVNLDLQKGKSYALVGPNGSGKTTLIKSLLGLIVPTRGDIYFEGQPVKGQWLYREKIGYMPQIGRYPDNMKIGQLIDMMKSIRAATRFDEELLLSFGLNDMRDKRMRTLSGGTRQKVSAALAFLFPSPVLIFDEPTAGLDPVSVEILKEKILREKTENKLLIISSHIMSDLDELTTDIIYLQDGNIPYNRSIEDIKDITGEVRLGKAIARLITNQNLKTIEASLC